VRERGFRIERVTFIGLGTMGGPMSAHLAAAGYPLKTFDRAGHGTASSVHEAVRDADVLVTMLPDGGVVRDVVLEAMPQLREGALVIDMSSADPAGSRALGRALAAHGIAMVDAPVSGAIAKAKDATLAIMVGGAKADVERARPILSKMGADLFHCGPLGAGHAVKALNNYLGAAGTLAGFEVLLVAKAFGLDPKPMLEAINASTGKNSTTERKIPQQVLTGAFASGFKLALMAKDVGIAADLAKGVGLRTPYLSETLRLWRDAQRSLPPQADHTEIYRFLERLCSPSRGERGQPPRSRRTPRRSSAKAGRRRPASASSSRARGRAAGSPARRSRRQA
jgi:3-hydroxyisobutyrate dehydrogenase